MFNEDNCGFLFFPYGNRMNVSIGCKTLVYLIAFEPKKTNISNINISLPGDFVSDDVSNRVVSFGSDNSLIQNEYDSMYFPNLNMDPCVEKMMSIPLASSICIGWSNDSFEYKDGSLWAASYRDLTEEGKKLYYSIKKLHNNKEVRILTFNNI